MTEFGVASFEWNEEAVTRDFESKAGKGIAAAAKFLTSRILEAINVQAPTKTYITRSGKVRKRATTRAIPGAPPRKVSGNLRRSTGWELVVERMALARIGVFSGHVQLDLDEGELEPWQYGGVLERLMDHKFIMNTLEAHRPQLESIVGGEGR